MKLRTLKLQPVPSQCLKSQRNFQLRISHFENVKSQGSKMRCAVAPPARRLHHSNDHVSRQTIDPFSCVNMVKPNSAALRHSRAASSSRSALLARRSPKSRSSRRGAARPRARNGFAHCSLRRGALNTTQRHIAITQYPRAREPRMRFKLSLFHCAILRTRVHIYPSICTM